MGAGPGEPDAWPRLGAVTTVDVDATTRLRPWASEDASTLAEAWTEPDIMRWLDPPPGTVARARRWIDGAPGRLHSGTALDLVIDRDGVVAGEVGLSSFDERRRACLVGYWLGAEHRGRGLAAASVGRLCAVAHELLGVRVVVAQCHPENVTSHRTAERAGFSLLADDHEGWRVYSLRLD